MSGLKVLEVFMHGQAKNLGIQFDDIIVSYNGKNLQSSDDLARAMAGAQQHQLAAVEVIVERNNERLVFDASLEPLGVKLAKAGEPVIASDIGQVKIVDFNMPFSSMVYFMVKLAIASIPAALILAVFWSIIATMLMGLAPIFR